MKKQLLANDVIHTDETTLQVLHEEGRLPSQISYMGCTGPDGMPTDRL